MKMRLLLFLKKYEISFLPCGGRTIFWKNSHEWIFFMVEGKNPDSSVFDRAWIRYSQHH